MTGQSKRIVSYSIFGSRTIPKEEKWLLYIYLRGLYFNVCMNALIYPDWTSHVEIDSGTYSDYNHFFNWLSDNYGMTYNINVAEPRCKAMLWRLKPIWNDTDIVLCRDADAITTWREKRQAVDVYLNLTAYGDCPPVHNILDNPAHSGIMGGMCGFKSSEIRKKWGSWEIMMQTKKDFKDHGSDQSYLNSIFNPDMVYYSNITGKPSIQGDPLWESDLCCRHIGSAGIVEMETIRFFRRLGLEKVGDFAKRYPEIFNWI